MEQSNNSESLLYIAKTWHHIRANNTLLFFQVRHDLHFCCYYLLIVIPNPILGLCNDYILLLNSNLINALTNHI